MIMLRALAATWLTDRPHEGVREPYERLLDVRDALHLTSGRALDRLLLGEVAEVAEPAGLRRPRRPAPRGEHGGPADRPRGRPDRPGRAPGASRSAGC